jgi:hypothetical protein
MSRYSLSPVFEEFKTNITMISLIIDQIAIEPASMRRDILIEGCFIRAVVTWETFLEEYILRCMCSAKTRNGNTLKPVVACSINTNAAFEEIHPNQNKRDQAYCDWLDADKLKILVSKNFHHRSRLHRIYEDPGRLYIIVHTRNAIAHRSQVAIVKFQKHVITQFGYLSKINPSMAELLITKKRSNGKLIFKDLIGYLYDLAYDLTE